MDKNRKPSTDIRIGHSSVVCNERVNSSYSEEQFRGQYPPAPQYGIYSTIEPSQQALPAPPEPQGIHAKFEGSSQTVVVATGHATQRQQRQPIPTSISSYMCLAVFTCLFCCLPLGLMAISHANEVKKYLARGDIRSAREASEKAFKYSMISILFGIVIIVGIVVYQVIYSGYYRNRDYL